jgi:hypothetical protein
MYTQFNKLANEFLSKMEISFPNEQKIKVYKQQYEFLQMMNSKKPVEMFMENMMPFGEQILLKDEMFFKQDEFVNSAESISGKMGLINYWGSMNDHTKNSIWEYVQGLYMLGMGSLGHGDELKKLIIITNYKS